MQKIQSVMNPESNGVGQSGKARMCVMERKGESQKKKQAER